MNFEYYNCSSRAFAGAALLAALLSATPVQAADCGRSIDDAINAASAALAGAESDQKAALVCLLAAVKELNEPTAFDAGDSTSLDFSKARIVTTKASCGAFQLSGMKDNSSYQLIIKGKAAGICSFAYRGGGVKSTYNISSVENTNTVVSLLKVGDEIFASSASGY